MANETEIPGTGGIPDLTKGGALTRINLRWAGPIGIFCGTWRPRGQKVEDVRQIQVLLIEKDSPADGILKVDDVILGADGTGAKEIPLFIGADSAMRPLAEAITEAEARNPAILKLLIWRPTKNSEDTEPPPEKVDLGSVQKMLKPHTEGQTLTVTIKLEPLGRYSDTAPYNCEKSKRILRNGVKALYESNDPGKFSMGILCLLAADDPTNPDNDKHQARAKEWMYKLMEKEVGGGAWESGVRLIVLSEYYMKTKDKTVFAYLTKQAEKHARGVSWFGTTGHKFADRKPDGSDSGRLSGYGPINCSGTQGFLGLSLARKAGVKSPVVDAAIERQRIFFGHWAFHSGMGYGEMPYGIAGGSGDRNGIHGMTALALGLQENKAEKAKYFTKLTALSTVQSRHYAHGGPFFGQVWQPVGAAQGGVKTANLQFREIRWHLDLKRKWNHLRIHDPTHQKYAGFCNGATALLFYAAPLKQIYVTGRDHEDALKLSDAEFKALQGVKTFNAAETSTQDLISELSRNQGMTRSAAAGELAERIKKDPESAESAALIDQLLTLAADKTATTSGRAGACTTLMYLKTKASEPVTMLKNTEIASTMVGLLKDPDPYIRFGGVRALQKLDPEAIRPHANTILDAIIATERPTFPLDEEDPCQWAHGEMGNLLFKHVLSKDLANVDRTKLIPAIRSVLKTPNGSARNSSSAVLDKLTMEETLAVADVLVDNSIVPPPANAMGGSAFPNCLKVFSKHGFEETLPLSALYDNGNGSGINVAIKHNIPKQYGSSVMRMSSARDFMGSLGDLMLVGAVDVTPVLNDVTDGAAPETLNKLKSIHSIRAAQPELKLPAAQTELAVDATNYGQRGEGETTYTWRKVYGAGKVSFTPNASGESKNTTVSFTDQKPGTYRFEVTMSDTLGLNSLSKTVDVTLFDKRGKLPRNKPPQATSRSLAAVPGRPIRVTLSGTDPDGDDLGFTVTKKPSHGRLSGVGGTLIYTAHFGHNGTDQLTFEAIDGQGERATGTVNFKVSDQNVGVVVYEGFDYPAGAIHERGGSPSFGFNGPWTNTKGAKDYWLVADQSLSYPALPSTGGKLVKGKFWWHLSRPLDTEALSTHKLLDNGRQLWFSVIAGGMKGRTKFRVGLRGGEAEGGADIGFVFEGTDLYAAKDGEKAGTSRIGWSRTRHVMFPENEPNMIIGRCIWGKTDDAVDTIAFYRVFDAPEFGPMVVKEPACIMREVIPQAKIDTVYMTDTATGVDEIRIGPTLHSVMCGTKPLGSRQ